MTTHLDSIAPVTGWGVKCSICQQCGQRDNSIARAVELARAAGWQAVEIRGQQITLCPDCAERAAQQNEAQS